MSSRDDMVIRPRLDGPQQASTPTRAREERVQSGHKHKAGLLGRFLRARGIKAVGRFAGGFARGVSAPLRAAAANPVGLFVGAVVVGVIAATRLLSGRSFEGMGADVKKVLLGNLSSDAMATRDAREHFTGDEIQSRIAAANGGPTSQQFAVFEDLKKLRQREYLAREAIELDPRFQSNNTADMLVLKARDVMVREWRGSSGPAALEGVRRKIEEKHSVKGGH